MRSTSCLAALVLLFGSASARAQNAWDPPDPGGFDPAVIRSGGSVELGFWTAGNDLADAASVSGLLRAGLAFADLFEVGVIAGWGWGEVDTVIGGADAASAANPLVHFAIVPSGDRWRARIGAGVAFPAAPGDSDARAAAFYAAASRGLSEIYLWAPNRLSIVPYGAIEAVPIDHLVLEGAVRTGLMIPVEDDTPAVIDDRDAGEFDVSIEASAAAGFRHEFFYGGARLRAVFVPTVEADEAQTSLELFARGTFAVPNSETLIFAEWRLDANLDDDLGFAFDELECPLGRRCGGVWGMFFVFGGGADLGL